MIKHIHYRKDETRFLDKYRKGVIFLERYERRRASGECSIAHERLKGVHLENMAIVEEAINAVAYEPYRNLLYYRFIKLLDYSEISKLVNSKPETVSRAIYRAIKKITIPEEVEV